MPADRKIVTGFRHYRQKTYRANADLFKKLAVGQNPRVMVVSCCDSRVDPAILTASDPGDLFILRNVASLVPPCEAGALSLKGWYFAIAEAAMFYYDAEADAFRSL